MIWQISIWVIFTLMKKEQKISKLLIVETLTSILQ
jgi:hypothetical protein